MSEKISSEHLSRAAYVYVRQSSAHQVRHHSESRRRQYALADRAKELGFVKTVVIDEDQGKSGSGLHERPGFGQLLAAVCSAEVGAVLALEASRLARNNRDWYHLIDLCAMTGTLIIDGEGVYDPQHLNDRLLLGLKGNMAEFELGLLRQRAREAYEEKVRRGHAMWELPVGLVRNDDDRIEKVADRQVQEAIEGVFRKFRELRSARQTMLWYRDENVLLPQVVAGTNGREFFWRLPTSSRIQQILRNPNYAGAFAWGRTSTKTTVSEGRPRQSSTRQRKPRDDWKVLILDNHTGYISWSDYLKNQDILEANSMREGTNTGAARTGPALLAGLLRCGRCGRKLFVAYSGSSGRTPRYVCRGGRTERGSASCLSIGSVAVERAIVEQVLAAVQPAGIEAALAVVHQQAERSDQKQRSMELALEKARYEVSRSRRQYDAVDPDNRLVAGELEARWNAALQNVAELEEQLASDEAVDDELTESQKQRLMSLSTDLPQLWHAPSTTDDLKKRILRSVLHEVVIDNVDSEDGIDLFHAMKLHWYGGVHTELQVRQNRIGGKRVQTAATAKDLIQELSKVCSDQMIAATLNRLGLKTGAGHNWRLHSVHNTRYYYRLPNYRNSDDWLTVEQTAIELKVSHTVIRRLIRERILPAEQVIESTPWIIRREDLALPAVQAAAKAVHSGRQPHKHNPDQTTLPFK